MISKEEFEEAVEGFKIVLQKLLCDPVKLVMYNEIITNYLRDLTEKYGQDFALSTTAYHVFCGCSAQLEKLERIDFPGEDSVSRFVENMVN